MSAHRSLPIPSAQQLALTIAAARQSRNQALWQLIGKAAHQIVVRLAGLVALRRTPTLSPHSHA